MLLLRSSGNVAQLHNLSYCKVDDYFLLSFLFFLLSAAKFSLETALFDVIVVCVWTVDPQMNTMYEIREGEIPIDCIKLTSVTIIFFRASPDGVMIPLSNAKSFACNLVKCNGLEFIMTAHVAHPLAIYSVYFYIDETHTNCLQHRISHFSTLITEFFIIFFLLKGRK